MDVRKDEGADGNNDVVFTTVGQSVLFDAVVGYCQRVGGPVRGLT